MAGLFGSKPQVQAQAPAPMPDSSSPAVLEAQRKAAAEAAARAGRASTIMTEGSGGPAANQRNSDSYSGKTLGGGG